MTDTNVPATRKEQPLTAVQQRDREVDAIKGVMLADVESNRGEIAQFLKGVNIEYDFFVSGLKVFLMRQQQTQPDFFTNVTQASFMEALFRCAKDGLIPDGKEAAIATYKGVATYLPMRDGLVKILWRTGQIRDINDQVVTKPEYDEDRFDYEEGSTGFIKHRPRLDRKDTDTIVAAYCVVNLVNGGSIREVVGEADLKKIAAMSRSPATRAWPMQMARKAAIRRVMGKMPRDPAVASVLAHDEDNYDFDMLDVNKTPTPSGVMDKLKAGGSSDAPGFAHGNVEKALAPPSEGLAPPIDIANLDIREPEYAEISATTGGGHAAANSAHEPHEHRLVTMIPDFDVVGWAGLLNRQLETFTNVDDLRDAWSRHKTELKAESPSLFRALKKAVVERSMALTNTPED